jgi:hypothetical protein
MGVRESLAKHQRLSLVVSLVFALGAGAYVMRSLFAAAPVVEPTAFYATDDGTEPFLDAPGKLPPFDHAGKPAYMAVVYSCDGGKTRFIGYLQRYTTQAKARIDARLKDPKIGPAHAKMGISENDIEVKKPGSANPWVNTSDAVAAARVTSVKCPDGSEAQLEAP